MKYAALMWGFGPGNPNMRGDKLRESFTGLDPGKDITSRSWLTIKRIIRTMDQAKNT